MCFIYGMEAHTLSEKLYHTLPIVLYTHTQQHNFLQNTYGIFRIRCCRRHGYQRFPKGISKGVVVQFQ